MPCRRVLLVDDDRELAAMLVEYLSADGWQVETAARGPDGLDAALSDRFDVLILDIMLPGMNGLDVLRALRAKSELPVIMLTARGDDTDRIVGLELGADDYLPKPFNPRELGARLRALTRRVRDSGDAPWVELHGLRLNSAERRVSVDGEPLALTGAEFSLLEALMKRPGEVLGKDELARHALGRELHAMDRSIDTHVSRLRAKLPASVRERIRIQAVRGRGYLLTSGPG
ncbi:response regulator transcription factor [Wenzhouxiangella limi]|uniref:Response regulator transcription factor n=1 Tax=Wenzhouxiangella limi TaxID=2707351 RepID=A0A845UW70_9GAMM|nr:response regulator transcription factor [Wenzhouxiangella limi]NDY94774.1 response regulator transcription factor [Wenzhouxiangella limi]